jgi:hypothetical protein
MEIPHEGRVMAQWRKVRQREPEISARNGELLHIQFVDDGEEYLCRYITLSESGVLSVTPYASTVQKVSDEEEEIYLHDIGRYRIIDVKELPLFVGWKYTSRHLADWLREARL